MSDTSPVLDDATIQPMDSQNSYVEMELQDPIESHHGEGNEDVADDVTITDNEDDVIAENDEVMAENDNVIPENDDVTENVTDKGDVTYTVVEGSSQRQRPKLLDSNGYAYTRYKASSDKPGKTLWRCVVRNRQLYCGSTVSQVGDKYIPGARKHCHPGKPGAYLAAKVVAQIKRKARDRLLESACHIVEDVLGDTLDATSETDIKPHNLTRMANRLRQKHRTSNILPAAMEATLMTDTVYNLQGLPEVMTESDQQQSSSLEDEAVLEPELGMTFTSYLDIERLIKNYENANHVKFFKSNSRTVACLKRKQPGRQLNDNLRYHRLTFLCVRHTDSNLDLSKAVNEALHRSGCQAKLRFAVTPDGNELALVELVKEHNHAQKDGTYHLFPQQKRQFDQGDEEVDIFKKRGKRLALEQIGKATGKVVTMKDIHNLSATSKFQTQCYNNLQSLLDQLSELGDSSGIVEVVTKDDGRIVGIFYQDQEMRRVYSSYPHYLTVDATCKNNAMKLPLYVLLNQDGNGDFEIVATFLVIVSNNENIRSMLTRFKIHNPSWQELLIIMADSAFAERQILREEFPNSAVHLCPYHTVKNFEQHLTNSKDRYDLHDGKKSHCVKLMRMMASAESEAAYMELYEQLLNTKLVYLIEYFNNNWHCIRHEWVEGMKTKTTYLKGESVTGKLDVVTQLLCTVFATAPDHVMASIRKVVELLRENKDHTAAEVVVEFPMGFSVDAVEFPMQFQHYVTPLAMKYILRQSKLSWKVKVKNNINDKSCIVKTSQGKLVVHVDTCPCRFWHSLSLPCCHVIAVRRYKGMSLFSKEMIGSWWTMAHYKSSCRLSAQPLGDDETSICRPAAALLSKQEKQVEVAKVVQQLAAVMSEAPSEQFSHQMKELKKLLAIFQNGSPVKVIELPGEGSPMIEEEASCSVEEADASSIPQTVFLDDQDIVTATTVTV